MSYTDSQIDFIPQMWSADEQHALSCNQADCGIHIHRIHSGLFGMFDAARCSGQGISTSDVVQAFKVLLALHGVRMPRFGKDAEKHEPGQNGTVMLELQTTSAFPGKI